MRGVAVNFFPLSTEDFTITVYRSPYVAGVRPQASDEAAVRRTLEIDQRREDCWTLFQQTAGGTPLICEPFNNAYLTIDALRLALLQSCQENLSTNQVHVVGGFRPRVEIIVGTHPEGEQVVSLEPYLLRSRGQFGFLADFRFHPNEGSLGTRRALQLSLSLDRHGRPNPNYYADRYSHLAEFVTEFHRKIFPLYVAGGQKVDVATQLAELPDQRLAAKSYVVGEGNRSNSQFMGVKQSGPLVPCVQPTHLYFLYRQADRPLSHDLFRALRGDTFRTFPGMKEMFHLPFSNDHVSGAPLRDFSADEILRVRDRVVDDVGERKVVPIVLTPFKRDDGPDENAAYWTLKHAFLAKGIPIQVVATDTVASKNQLQWSASGIGLQVFAKAGGTPWKVLPETENCLVVGIGQAHHKSQDRFDRYFAYSVLTDSSGVFEEVRVLGEDRNEEDYIRKFSSTLRNIFAEYSSRFSSFVVHSTFEIRRKELESIAAVLSEQQEHGHGGEFVSLKFNDRNRFFGFAVDHNSRVPFESTVVPLSKNEFLVWFEGLQYGQSTVRGMIGRPLHIEFTYPTDSLTQDQKRRHLQDAINLSGANWRGFNAKSLPISVYYAQIIARYLKEFEKHGLPEVNVATLTPWFL